MQTTLPFSFIDRNDSLDIDPKSPVRLFCGWLKFHFLSGLESPTFLN